MKNLLYLGTSIANQRLNPLESKVKFCTAEELSKIKVSHDDYKDFIVYLKNNLNIDEITLLSTCNRFEVIIFLKAELDDKPLEKASVIEAIRNSIFHYLEKQVPITTLSGHEAELQILRTYCGLNSGLVGESEICMQFKGSFRQALSMGFFQEQGEALLAKAEEMRSFFDQEIYVSPVSYCEIAINKALMSLSLMSPINSVTILGSGSTAIQSSIALTKNNIQAGDMTLIHRVSSSSQQIELFKSRDELSGLKFVRSKKHGYKTPKIADHCSRSDLVVFGIDSRQPVIRFPERHHQVIFDFNSTPSCDFDGLRKNENYFPLSSLDAFVREYSFRQNNDFELSARLNFGERYIQHRLKETSRSVSSSLV